MFPYFVSQARRIPHSTSRESQLGQDFSPLSQNTRGIDPYGPRGELGSHKDWRDDLFDKTIRNCLKDKMVGILHWYEAATVSSRDQLASASFPPISVQPWVHPGNVFNYACLYYQLNFGRMTHMC